MHHSVFCAISGPESPIILGPKGSLNSEWGQRRIAIVHVFCSCIICFAVVPCILHLCFLFSRCAKTMYYSYVQFCWCANEIAVVPCILQLYIQFVSCELFSQLYNIFPCLPGFSRDLVSRSGNDMFWGTLWNPPQWTFTFSSPVEWSYFLNTLHLIHE